MRDPRVVEIEFLADLELHNVGTIVTSDYEKKLGVSGRFFKDMVLNLFNEGCLEGSSSIGPRPEIYGDSRDEVLQVGQRVRHRSIGDLLGRSRFSAYINHKGRVRLWNLRDQLQKARAKEK